MGAALARLEARVLLSVVLERIADIQRIPDEEIAPVCISFISGAQRLPISFTRRP
jgi:cytochrome P450